MQHDISCTGKPKYISDPCAVDVSVISEVYPIFFSVVKTFKKYKE